MDEKVYVLRHIKIDNDKDATMVEGYQLSDDMRDLLGNQYSMMSCVEQIAGVTHKKIGLFDQELYEKRKEMLVQTCEESNMSDARKKQVIRYFLSQTVDIELEEILYIPKALLQSVDGYIGNEGDACTFLHALVTENGKKILLLPEGDDSSV